MEHKHHGKSSSRYLDAEDILNEFHFNGDETFMDAGCGDGYISIKAAEKYLVENFGENTIWKIGIMTLNKKEAEKSNKHYGYDL